MTSELDHDQSATIKREQNLLLLERLERERVGITCFGLALVIGLILLLTLPTILTDPARSTAVAVVAVLLVGISTLGAVLIVKTLRATFVKHRERVMNGADVICYF